MRTNAVYNKGLPLPTCDQVTITFSPPHDSKKQVAEGGGGHTPPRPELNTAQDDPPDAVRDDGAPRLRLEGQTTWVAPDGRYVVRVRASGDVPDGAVLTADLHGATGPRTGSVMKAAQCAGAAGASRVAPRNDDSVKRLLR